MTALDFCLLNIPMKRRKFYRVRNSQGDFYIRVHVLFIPGAHDEEGAYKQTCTYI